MFGTQGLVWCPVGIHDELVHDPVNFIQFNINPITNEFTQIGDPASIWNSNNGAENLTTAQITLTVDRNYEIVDSYNGAGGNNPNDFVQPAMTTPPVMALLQDTVISIHVQPNGLPPVVELGPYDITSR
ncbi:hypothetical protein M9Y10_011280 [Tritrichomonas musculus]|uniref:Uncharacterized protein n=1 Tax=Tritrichomonas musculus TaxID=1915356 RepID=A0ABR2IKD2_9EUKA